jgi:hypothetical protein
MCFSFEILNIFACLLFISKVITTQISTNLLESSRTQVGFMSETLTRPSFSAPELYINTYWKSTAYLFLKL